MDTPIYCIQRRYGQLIEQGKYCLSIDEAIALSKLERFHPEPASSFDIEIR
jgi:hypothetical protein